MPRKPLSGLKARQGRLGRPVLAVLVASLVLIVIYVAGLMLWANSDSLQRTTSEPGRPLGGPDSSVEQGTSGQGSSQNR